MTSWQSDRTRGLIGPRRVTSAFGIRLSLSGLALLAAVGAASVATAFMQVPDDPSPESGTAQVVAQGVADIRDGELRWRVTERTAQPPANAADVVSDLGFVSVDAGVMLVEDRESGEQQRLPAGEAALYQADARQSRVALGSSVASYRDMALVDAATEPPGDGEVIFQSDPFAGTGSRNDLDLLQDSLAPGATTNIPAGALPTLILVQDGIVDIATESGDVLSLGAGEAATLTGPLVVTAGEGGAVIAAAVTGPAVPTLAQAAATPQAGRAVQASDEEEPVAVVIATPAAAAVTTPTAADAGPDDDNDGLAAAREAEVGTDPALADTDEDGLTDGQEVLEFGTHPLVADTDGDGVLDGDEIAQGFDPNDSGAGAVLVEEAPPAEEPAAAAEEPVAVEEPAPAAAATPGDSDGDGLEDAIEYELGTDPFDIDTDDDGLTDGDEYYIFATGTRNPDSDGDGVLDGDEIAVGTDPNNPAS